MFNLFNLFKKKKTEEELYQDNVNQSDNISQNENTQQDENIQGENISQSNDIQDEDSSYTDDRSNSESPPSSYKLIAMQKLLMAQKFFTDILNKMSVAKKRKLKKQLIYIGIPVFLVGGLLLYQGTSTTSSHRILENLPDEQDVKVLSGATNGTNLDNSFLDANEAEQAKQDDEIQNVKDQNQKQVELLQQQIKIINDKFVKSAKESNQEKIDLMNQIQGLEQKTQDLTKSYSEKIMSLETKMHTQASMPQGNASSSSNTQIQMDKNGNPIIPHMINRIALTQSNSKIHDIRYYLPTGSYAKATIISGVDADVGVESQGDPRPILFRITNKAISADVHKRHNLFDVRGCTVTGAAYGDLSSEKVYVRLQKMTCSRHRGKVFEFQVEGYSAGDGKTGIRGHLISRMGNKLVKAGVAGFVSGMGTGISDFLSGATGVASSGININTGSNSQVKDAPKLADILKGGVAKGTSGTADMLAKYYIKRAELMNPVISLQSGKQVELVFLKGVDLKEFLKHKIS